MEKDKQNQDKSKEQRVHDAYSEMGKKGGESRNEQLGHEGYVEMGKKVGSVAKNLHERIFTMNTWNQIF